MMAYFSSFSQEILEPTNEKSYTEYMDNVLESLVQNDIRIIRVVINGEQVTKMIFKD